MNRSIACQDGRIWRVAGYGETRYGTRPPVREKAKGSGRTFVDPRAKRSIGVVELQKRTHGSPSDEAALAAATVPRPGELRVHAAWTIMPRRGAAVFSRGPASNLLQYLRTIETSLEPAADTPRSRVDTHGGTTSRLAGADVNRGGRF